MLVEDVRQFGLAGYVARAPLAAAAWPAPGRGRPSGSSGIGGYAVLNRDGCSNCRKSTALDRVTTSSVCASLIQAMRATLEPIG